jgi:hypothetical protein
MEKQIMNHSKVEVEFNTALDNTDYGLIVGKNGCLKGIWIPNALAEGVIPDAVVNLCVEHFGINPNTSEQAAPIQ